MKFYCSCTCHASLIGCTLPEAQTLLLPPSNTCFLPRFKCHGPVTLEAQLQHAARLCRALRQS